MKYEPEREPEDSLGRLIARAGRRVEPPESIQAQVHAVVREEWQRVTQRRRRRNLVALAAAASVAFAAVGFGVFRTLPAPASLEPIGRIVRSVGDVRLVAPGTVRPSVAAPGHAQLLRAGEEIVTGEGAGVNVWVAGEISVRVGAHSRLRWQDRQHVRLLEGAVYVDSPPRAGAVPLAGKFSIETAHGSVTHVGTQYLALVSGDALTVRVREGLVMLDADGAREVARAAEELTVDRSGAVARARFAPQGPDWAWVEALAAGFDVSNRSLLEFLEWVARETGRTLEFVDEQAREEARTTILQGSTRGLTVGQALDSVMATTNFTATLTDDRLLISRR